MIQINSSNFENEVLKHSGDVVVEFYKPKGCGNCEQMKPVMEEFEKNNPTVKVCIYECGDKPDEISSTYQFRMFPGIFSFKEGKPVRGFSGVKTLKQLSMIFLLPHELKMLYADAQIHADQIKDEVLNYNQGTQVIYKEKPQEYIQDKGVEWPGFKGSAPVVFNSDMPEIADPADETLCDGCQ